MNGAKVTKLLATIYVTAFLLHFVWEMWQIPFYAGMLNANHWQALRLCTQATAGDGVITLLAYGLTAMLSRNGSLWLFRDSSLGWSVFLSSCILITVVLELLATKFWDRWQYSELMPVIPYLDIGVLPILQWIMLPPLTLWISSVFVKGLEDSKYLEQSRNT